MSYPGFDSPQIDYKRHGISDDMYDRFGRGRFVSIKVEPLSAKSFNKKDIAEQCEVVNKRTHLLLKPDGVEHCEAMGNLVNITFQTDSSSQKNRQDTNKLSSGVVELSLPTVIKKQGSQWVGCNLDYEPITDTYATKKELMNEVGASGTKGIGKDEAGKIYAVFYDHETIQQEQG